MLACAVYRSGRDLGKDYAQNTTFSPFQQSLLIDQHRQWAFYYSFSCLSLHCEQGSHSGQNPQEWDSPMPWCFFQVSTSCPNLPAFVHSLESTGSLFVCLFLALVQGLFILYLEQLEYQRFTLPNDHRTSWILFLMPFSI